MTRMRTHDEQCGILSGSLGVCQSLELPWYSGGTGGSANALAPVSRDLIPHTGWISFQLLLVSNTHVPKTETCSPIDGVGSCCPGMISTMSPPSFTFPRSRNFA